MNKVDIPLKLNMSNYSGANRQGRKLEVVDNYITSVEYVYSKGAYGPPYTLYYGQLDVYEINGASFSHLFSKAFDMVDLPLSLGTARPEIGMELGAIDGKHAVMGEFYDDPDTSFLKVRRVCHYEIDTGEMFDCENYSSNRRPTIEGKLVAIDKLYDEAMLRDYYFRHTTDLKYRIKFNRFISEGISLQERVGALDYKDLGISNVHMFTNNSEYVYHSNNNKLTLYSLSESRKIPSMVLRADVGSLYPFEDDKFYTRERSKISDGYTVSIYGVADEDILKIVLFDDDGNVLPPKAGDIISLGYDTSGQPEYTTMIFQTDDNSIIGIDDAKMHNVYGVFELYYRGSIVGYSKMTDYYASKPNGISNWEFVKDNPESNNYLNSIKDAPQPIKNVAKTKDGLVNIYKKSGTYYIASFDNYGVFKFWEWNESDADRDDPNFILQFTLTRQ